MAVHNADGAKQLEDMGFSTVVLARELTLEEMRAVAQSVSCRCEAFIHGAHCMSLSGACYLSVMLGGRSGNRGLCAQPCRLDFRCGGREYALSLKDMSYLDSFAELSAAGAASFKIEGRMKTEYYVAVVTNAYRRVLDGTMTVEEAKQELDTVSHRPYTTGFYHGELPRDHSNAGTYSQTRRFVGTVLSCENGVAEIEQRNRFEAGDALEVVSPVLKNAVLHADSITDETGAPVTVANRVKQVLRVKTDLPLQPGDLLRL
jgi:putative protease